MDDYRMEHHHIKKLYRAKENRLLAGVLAGIGEYSAIDATVIRVIFLATTIITGVVPFALLYILLALVVPEKNERTATYDETGKRIY